VEGLTKGLPARALQKEMRSGLVGGTTGVAGWGVYESGFETVAVKETWSGAKLGDLEEARDGLTMRVFIKQIEILQ
jgi:hypothetical protein